MLTIILMALGNRTWGDASGSHWLGALVMTYATVLANPHAWMWSPVFLGLIMLFRAWTVAPWLDETHGAFTVSAILRAAAILPYACFLFYLDRHIAHLIAGACFPVIAMFYWIAGKQLFIEPVAFAECLVGIYLGTCAI